MKKTLAILLLLSLALNVSAKESSKSSTTKGTVNVAGHNVNYEAVADKLTVHPKGWKDTEEDKDKNSGEAQMFYVYYHKRGVKPGARPITFLYNGGPGSATVWLHMGAFGPRRVVTADDSHTPAAPYRLVNNDASLLDVSDLVFIDAPGAGFSRVTGKDQKKDFYGVDPDGHAFAEFIQQFLSKYNRWNSPKYIFGESYGTTRSAVVANLLQSEYSVDLNGVILLSQILNFALNPDGPEANPGVDLPYELVLPTYAAAAWYHHKLPEQSPGKLETLLNEVEHFATNDYALALMQGNSLPEAQRDAVAAKLHRYTGLPVEYIKKADLRINGGEFGKSLQEDSGLTTGRLDSRFSGPTIDPLSRESQYDPQFAAIGSAYVTVFNSYVRNELKYGKEQSYKLFANFPNGWEFKHRVPGSGWALTTNVMPDLAHAMIQNPGLKVMLNAGYFDLATPYYQGVYEMEHLPIPASLKSNIEYAFYPSGHMVYAHNESLYKLHDKVADFIRRTDNL